jgi:L-arabinose isomerase
MPYGQFRPASGLRKCLNGWLSNGGPHHEVMNLGHHAADWKAFCQVTGIEFVQVPLAAALRRDLAVARRGPADRLGLVRFGDRHRLPPRWL